MLRFAQLCESISRTTKKLEKLALVSAYFQDVSIDEASQAAVLLSGRAFPAYEETTLSVGGALLSRLLTEVTAATGHELNMAYRRHGDLGSAAFDLYSEKLHSSGAPSFRSDSVARVSELEGPYSTTDGCPTLSAAKGGNNDHSTAPPITLHELGSVFRKIAAASGPSAKTPFIRDLLQRAAPIEAKYLIKFMGGDLRIGLRESLVEEAIGRTFDESYFRVRRANMLLGDIGATLRLAAAHQLDTARMRLFHPLGTMLASPVENSLEAISYLEGLDIQVEDKYDGIRAQVHCGPDPESPNQIIVRIFSRTLDDITASFPELAESLRRFRGPLILDGEIVAWQSNVGEEGSSSDLSSSLSLGDRVGDQGHALPFTSIQQRLGRKSPSMQLIRKFPVAFVAFDVLYTNNDLVLDQPLRERRAFLQNTFSRLSSSSGVTFAPSSSTNRSKPSAQQDLFAPPASVADSVPLSPVILAPAFVAHTPEELDALFDSAQARGNEGLMLKDLASTYSPGRRGKAWLKLKRELATLDVVVTAVEFGHGKRAAVLSDYTFAVRDTSQKPRSRKKATGKRSSPPGEDLRLLNVGKAYSGLTDIEIAELTEWFKQHTLADHGHSRLVDPQIVLEVAFNNVMESDRHESGYALRFPRIMRLRPDKPVAEIDTLERVKELFEKQHSTSRETRNQ